MTTQRFTSVAAVAVAAVLSAVFVAGAPAQALGMADGSMRSTRVEPRDETCVGLALRAASLGAVEATPTALPSTATRMKTPSAEKPARAAALTGAARTSGA
jgi:hypothetical protein